MDKYGQKKNEIEKKKNTIITMAKKTKKREWERNDNEGSKKRKRQWTWTKNRNRKQYVHDCKENERNNGTEWKRNDNGENGREHEQK